MTEIYRLSGKPLRAKLMELYYVDEGERSWSQLPVGLMEKRSEIKLLGILTLTLTKSMDGAVTQDNDY